MYTVRNRQELSLIFMFPVAVVVILIFFSSLFLFMLLFTAAAAVVDVVYVHLFSSSSLLCTKLTFLCCMASFINEKIRYWICYYTQQPYIQYERLELFRFHFRPDTCYLIVCFLWFSQAFRLEQEEYVDCKCMLSLPSKIKMK